MGIRSTLSAFLSAPIAAAVEARVRAIVDDSLAQHDVVDAAEVRELTAAVATVRAGADALKREIAAAQQAAAALSTSVPEAPAPRAADQALTEARGRLDALSSRLVTVTEQVARAEARAERAADDAARATTLAARQAPAASAPVAAAPVKDRGCKVPGCAADHRARGFCGKHYQMWKRSTLPGFVGEDGTLFAEVDGPRWQLSKSYAGEPGRLDGGVVRVADRLVDAVPAAV